MIVFENNNIHYDAIISNDIHVYINKHIHQASLKEVEPAGSLSNGDQVVYLNLTLRFISIN